MTAQPDEFDAATAEAAKLALMPRKGRKVPAGSAMSGDSLETPALSTDDFFSLMTIHQYIYRPTRELWPAVSVNARVPPQMDGPDPIPANRWLDRRRAVEQMTWVPGEPEIIRGRLMKQGGWIEQAGASSYNSYHAPTLKGGDPSKAHLWVTHLKRTFPDSAHHIISWLAHRVQRPGEKLNHALVLGGGMGIGKDTILEPVKHAVGAWNFAEASPTQLLGQFNAFVKSVILRVSEARDLGDVDRYAFHDHTKTLIASPPDALLVNEKNIRAYMVPNVCGVVITTNDKLHGLYLEKDDRRHYVAWSDCTKEQFAKAYWDDFYAWYSQGGLQHVAAYLRDFDISGFLPKAPPPKTTAFWEIVEANSPPEDSDISDVLTELERPAALTLEQLKGPATAGLRLWLNDIKNRRKVGSRLMHAGYVVVRNENQTDGRWKVAGKNVAVYARSDLPIADRVRAAEHLVFSGGRL